ncbi:MAG: quinol:cytochrome C oxidoreductase [Solitalea-like symbiont of Acarus siro]
MDTNNTPYRFQLSQKVKILSLIAISIGLISIVISFIAGDSERIWANLLLCSYYIACLGFAGTMFIAVQLVTRSGWSLGVVRIAEAMSKAPPFFALLLLIIIIGGLFTHNLYHHWSDPNLINTLSDKYDPAIAKKAAYLNAPFFIIRVILFTGAWVLFGTMICRYSQKQDTDPNSLQSYDKAYKYAAIFCVIFGFTYPLFAFDVIMSIEAHWFSTMFGWYNLAGLWVSGVAVITIITIVLKEKNIMPYINSSHLHDLGKYLFGFSIFWAYTWLGQFLLIWYANIPEEVSWFTKRFTPEYKFIFWFNLVINLALPLLALMTSDAKRRTKSLLIVAIIIVVGHWLDYYLMVMPGSVGSHRGFSYAEFGTLIGFFGLFTLIVMNALTKAELLPKNHPFTGETLHHEVENI